LNESKLILKYNKPFIKGIVLSRLNRFTLLVKLNNSNRERVYLANPGKLSTVLERGREILCTFEKSKNRKTHYNAFAIKINNFYVTVNSNFANTIFENIIRKKLIPEFKDFDIKNTEKLIPEYGRIDFSLKTPNDKELLVEVKSCTHVENGIAKFPDRPTERGKRHLKALIEMKEMGIESIIVFIVQRPDAIIFEPFREIDPEFSDLLKEVYRKGIRIKAISTEFVPPDRVYLLNDDLKVNL
jgi:sugar fermentation stimulation protein A